MTLHALVLGGGNALGAYHGGAYEALVEAGEAPSWICGTSIGAITAALIAGSPPDQRLDHLHRFWRDVSAPDWLPALRRASQWLGAAEARLVGRPEFYRLRMPLLSTDPSQISLYDSAPLRQTLGRLIDFERLNAGDIRITVVATDLETGAEVTFDSTRERIELDHVVASAALIPDFAPVHVSGRWLGDGGLSLNTPVDPVLTGPTEPTVCFVSDLFPLSAPIPRSYGGMAQRHSDLIFARQTARALERAAAIGKAGKRIDVMRIAYSAEEETPMKSWDFSSVSGERRWRAGRADMAAAVATWRALPPRDNGLVVHPVTSLNDSAG